jgi:hypothetical protein
VKTQQPDLFDRPPQYPGWKPDPMSTEAHQANFELMLNGRTDKPIMAQLFRGTVDPFLAKVRWMSGRL